MSELDPGPLLEMLTAYQSSMILMASSELGIFDELGGGGLAAAEVASRLTTAPRTTEMLLNACVAVGLLRKTGQRFENSPLAQAFLVGRNPDYLGRVVAKEQEFYDPWGKLAESVRRDKAQLPPMLERLRGDPNTAQNFLFALHDLALLFGASLPDVVHLEGRNKLLDVGGGVGTYSILLAQRHPELQAVVLDLPPVRTLAEEMIASYGLSDRISFQSGDYEAPTLGEGYDVILLANVLHDNPVPACKELLFKSQDALVDGGLVVINEFFLDAHKTGPPVAAIFSLIMLLENQGASAYSAEEIKEWLLEAGFQDPVAQRLPEPSPMVVITGRKA
jgi:2-polyprenyl-3-methyl-5-hydroxy-6-metoxy-1,4-benzoquinol methylase